MHLIAGIQTLHGGIKDVCAILGFELGVELGYLAEILAQRSQVFGAGNASCDAVREPLQVAKRLKLFTDLGPPQSVLEK